MGRRGFTVLETVLAATLASVVVLGCMTAFFALERTDQALSARFEEANDLARIQRTMERAFTTFLVAEQSPEDEQEEQLAEEANGENGENGEEGEEGEEGENGEGGEGQEEEPEEDAEAEAAEAGAAPQMPRILLEADTDPTLTSMISRARFAAGGGGGSVAAPQRLEVVLSSVPIRPAGVQSSVWANALVGVEDVELEADAEASGAEEYDGVRGAFVLRPDDTEGRQARAREARGEERVGWTLWWQPLDDRSEPARVASGLAACSYQMFFDRQMQSDFVAYDQDQLPTYIQVEVETLSGLYASYLFEVVWTVDTIEPEASASGSGGEGADGAGDGGRDGQGGGADGGDGQGTDRRPRDSGARPKGMTPQGARPGGEVTGRPAGVRRPGPGGPRDGGGG